MLASELLDRAVVDGRSDRLGLVVDVRLALPGDPEQQVPARVQGLLVSPHNGTPFLGYERTDVNSPVPIAALLRWLHRGTFLVAWEDLARIEEHRIVLRPGFRRYSADLRHGSQYDKCESP